MSPTTTAPTASSVEVEVTAHGYADHEPGDKLHVDRATAAALVASGHARRVGAVAAEGPEGTDAQGAPPEGGSDAGDTVSADGEGEGLAALAALSAGDRRKLAALSDADRTALADLSPEDRASLAAGK